MTTQDTIICQNRTCCGIFDKFTIDRLVYKMSFTVRKKVVEEGDTIILYLNVNNLHAIEVATHAKNKKNQLIEKVFQTSFGALKIKDLIGHEYGTKV